MQVENYKINIRESVLKGNFSLSIPKWGVTIHNMSHFLKDGRMWVSFPANSYEKDGEKKYFPYLSFKDKNMQQAFMEKACDALREYLKTQQPSPITHPQRGQSPIQPKEEELPF